MENKFKVGDKVKRVGGNAHEVVTGNTYTINEIRYEGKLLDFKEIDKWGYEARHFELAKPLTAAEKKKQKEDLVKKLTKYRVFGTGCNNKGDEKNTLKEAKEDAKIKVDDTSWRGDLIIQKITPVCKVTIEKKIKEEKL